VDEAHLTMETLARLLSGGMTYEELLEKVVPHLLERCAICQELHREILRMQAEVGHWNEEVVVAEGFAAPQLWERIAGLPYEEQVVQVEGDTDLQNWGFCQFLLKKSLEAGFGDPTAAVNFANLAVKISLRLGDVYHPEWVQDIRARALAYLGNSRRVLGELRSADDAVRFAVSGLKEGTGDPRLLAELLDFQSSLRRAQRRLPEALTCAGQALDLYKSCEDSHGIAKTTLAKVQILKELGDLEGAIELLERNEIDPIREPRLFAYARYNLLGCLPLAGRFKEAEDLLPEVRQLFGVGEQAVNLLRLRWTEANIALGLGRIAEAESAFHEVQAAFLERSMAYDAALVSLDLAVVYLRERKLPELKQLASGLVLLFESRDVHREALGALYLFQKACEEEQLTEQAVNRLADVLRRRQTAREA
jgi:tetratricopeptide (TPR) repeat protein